MAIGKKHDVIDSIVQDVVMYVHVGTMVMKNNYYVTYLYGYYYFSVFTTAICYL